jgi:SAM-dependent methyltransferase
MPAPPTLEETTRLSRERLRPSLRNPSWLVLRQRRRIFEERIQQLPSSGLRVLDVGGRLQPYRPLLGERVQSYLAIDPDLTPLVNAAALAENLPFRDEQFDLVICTQVMEYFPEPARAVEEMWRVLRKGGYAFVSAPSVFVRDHEKEYWRFLPAGLAHLFRRFESMEVIAEGNSASGMVRAFNVFLTSFFRPRFLLPVCQWTLVPLLNMAGLLLEKAGGHNEDFAANFSVWARK